MTSPILVTGGTGTLGRLVLPRLHDAGYDVRVLSRHGHESTDGIEYRTGDLATGVGLENAVDGVETIVHLGGTAKGDEEKTRNLVEAASKAGVQHLVYVSVVGADRVPVVSGVDRAMFGYFASKLGAERVIAESGIPWTTLRATQFHDSMLAMFQAMSKSPVMPVSSGFRFQPIAASEVADRLVELTHGEPSGLVPDLAGPRVYGMRELGSEYLGASGKRRLLLPVRLPGKAARAYREGANLAPEHAHGNQTWMDFLAERIGS